MFNQAIMEFGALQCVPKNPDCKNCPLHQSCFAFAKKRVEELPFKSKKTKVRNRYFNYLLYIDSENKTLVQKRTEKGIWHNLYEFPVIETEKEEKDISILTKIKAQNSNFINATHLKTEDIIHKLSHQHLHISFWKIEINSFFEEGISYKELQKLPVPIVLHNFIERNSF